MDLMSFVGGCLGGFAGIISSYPFDTIKVRIQNQHMSNDKYRGAIDCLIKTIKKESTSALYKGVTSPLVGSMAINALLFGVENNIRKRLGIDNTDEQHPRPYHLYALSGAIAGLTQSFLLSPVELVKIKMQIPNSKYTSTWQCARDLMHHSSSHHHHHHHHAQHLQQHLSQHHTRHGAYHHHRHNLMRIAEQKRHVLVLTRGTWLTVLRDVPGVGSYFFGFEYACDWIKSMKRDGHHQQTAASSENLSVTSLLVAGGLAGCFSWIVTYPIDVIKTRFQADFEYRNVRECLKRSLANEGHMMLWRGLTPTLLRAFPNNAAVFATVTLFNRFVNNSSQMSDHDESTDDLDDLTYSTYSYGIPTRLQTEFLMDTYDLHR